MNEGAFGLKGTPALSADEEWHRVRIVVHEKEDKIDLYLDGQLVVEGAAGAKGNRPDLVTPPYSFRFWTSSGDVCTYYIDDVVIYEGTEPIFPESVSPNDKLSTTWGFLRNYVH